MTSDDCGVIEIIKSAATHFLRINTSQKVMMHNESSYQVNMQSDVGTGQGKEAYQTSREVSYRVSESYSQQIRLPSCSPRPLLQAIFYS